MGSVSSIETMSCVDGPGIRIVIFLNGCKKRCLFCHNPEMFTMKKDNMTELELVNKIKRYKTYFGKKGGVTFSGGEPLLQTNFLIKVLKELKKENINVAIETSGDYLGDIDELLKYTDIIILDIKYTFNFSSGTYSLYYWYQFGSKVTYNYTKSVLYKALLFILSVLELDFVYF